jgi:hypothetical protein
MQYHAISNVQYPMSNIRYPISNIRHSMFDVRCSTSNLIEMKVALFPRCSLLSQMKDLMFPEVMPLVESLKLWFINWNSSRTRSCSNLEPPAAAPAPAPAPAPSSGPNLNSGPLKTTIQALRCSSVGRYGWRRNATKIESSSFAGAMTCDVFSGDEKSEAFVVIRKHERMKRRDWALCYLCYHVISISKLILKSS